MVILSLGRFIHLGEKPYWNDEVYTSLRISGYTKLEVLQELGSDRHTFGDLKVYQCLQPQKTLEDSLNGLIVDDVHPPLYFILIRLWATLGGCQVGYLRLFSALISLFLIPLTYTIAKELFDSFPISLMATGLITLSPIYLIYAQEARSYSLLTLISLGSSFMLLKIIKRSSQSQSQETVHDWIPYIGLSTLGLYTHTLYYLVLFVQSIYVQFRQVYLSLFQTFQTFQAVQISVTPDQHYPAEGEEISNSKHHNSLDSKTLKSLKYQFIAILISISLFGLWLIRTVLIQGMKVNIGANYTWKAFPLSLLGERIALNLTSLFFDFYDPIKENLLNSSDRLFSLSDLSFLNQVTIVLLVLLVCYALIYTLRRVSPLLSGFMVALCLPSVIFLLKDLLLGGNVSTIIRYQLLTCFVVYLCIAFCSVDQLKKQSNIYIQGAIVMAIVVIFQLQLYSNLTYLNASTWWSKVNEAQIETIATIVNTAKDPFLLIEANHKRMVNLIGLSHLLRSSIPFQILSTGEESDTTSKLAPLSKLASTYSLFLYHPSPELLTEVQSASLYPKPLENDRKLYRLYRLSPESKTI